MKTPELITKLQSWNDHCDDRCVDLRTLKFEVKDGETRLFNDDVSYFFKSDPKKPKDPAIVHAGQQFCKLIGVPFSFYFKNPEEMRKRIVDCWLNTVEAERSMVLMKLRRTGPQSQGWVIRAILPVEYTNITNVQVLEKVAEVSDEFEIEFSIGDGRDDLILHVRFLNKTFEVFGDQYQLGFGVTASELGAHPLTVETLLYRVGTKSSLIASYSGESYFSCPYTNIQSKDLSLLFPQLVERMKNQLSEIKSKIQAMKELKCSSVEGVLTSLKLKKGLSGKFHRRLWQELNDNPPKDIWDIAGRGSVIAKDFNIEVRMKIEKAMGDLVGLTFQKQ